MARKKQGMPKGESQGRALSPLKKELIWQAFLLSGNKNEVAREFKISAPSVANVVKAYSEVDPAIKEARISAISKMTGRVHEKALEVLDSIGPKDLDRAALSQKGVTTGILIDKLEALRKHEAELRGNEGSDRELLLPGEAKALLEMISGKVKQLGILNVHFKDQQPDLTDEIQNRLAAAQAAMEIEAVVKNVEDLDP